MGLLTFSGGIDLPEGSRVRVKPDIAADGKIEFSISPSETGEMTVVVSDYGLLPKNKKNAYTSRKLDDGSIEYEYSIKVPENASAYGSISAIGSRVGNIFLDRYREWFGDIQGQQPKERKNIFLDGLNKVSNWIQGGGATQEEKKEEKSTNNYGV